MKKLGLPAYLSVLGAIALSAAPPSGVLSSPAMPFVSAQDAPALPSAESILDKSVEASGGKAAFAKVKNLTMKGSMDMMGMKLNVTIYKAEPNLSLTEIEMPGMGKMLEGTDGTTAWSYNPMQGPSVKSGKAANEALFGADFREENWRERFTKVETLALETVEGEECYKVAITPKVGDHPMTNYYSKKSGLLIKTVATTSTDMGEITGEVLPKDYRKVGDLMMPFQIVNRAMGQSMTMTFSEIKVNVDIPKSTCEPPAEVKALIKK
jgi:outer membrane lipoprotein-sorting protein